MINPANQCLKTNHRKICFGIPSGELINPLSHAFGEVGPSPCFPYIDAIGLAN